MGLLNRHEDIGGTRYQMREKIFSIGDDLWIDTDEGQHAYKVNGKALRIRSTFVLESPEGRELFKIQEKKLRVRDTMEVERDGETVATIKKALISPLRDRFAINVEGGGELLAQNMSLAKLPGAHFARRLQNPAQSWSIFSSTAGICRLMRDGDFREAQMKPRSHGIGDGRKSDGNGPRAQFRQGILRTIQDAQHLLA